MPAQSIDPAVLRTALEKLLADAPDFQQYSPYSEPHIRWLGHVEALLTLVDWTDNFGAKMAMNLLGGYNHAQQVGKIFRAIHAAIKRLEMLSGGPGAQVYGPGAVYDFFRKLRSVITVAKTNLLIVDPYLDDTIFATYLDELPPSVATRLLCRRYAPRVSAAAVRFNSQFGTKVAVRADDHIHDRVIFSDGTAWVLGHSIKDAAAKTITYLAPLSPDISADKLAYYEEVWNAAKPV